MTKEKLELENAKRRENGEYELGAYWSEEPISKQTSDKLYLERGDHVYFQPYMVPSVFSATLVDYTLPTIRHDYVHFGEATLIGPKISGEWKLPLFEIEQQNKLVKEHFESKPLPQFYVSDFPSIVRE